MAQPISGLLDPIGALFRQWNKEGMAILLGELQRLAEEGHDEPLRPWLPVLRGVLGEERAGIGALRGLLLLCLSYSVELRILLFADSRVAHSHLRCNPGQLTRPRIMQFLVALGGLIAEVGSHWTMDELETLAERAHHYWHYGRALRAPEDMAPA